MSRPPGDHRNANSAFIDLPLLPTERSIRFEHIAEWSWPAVVAAEEHNCVVSKLQLLKQSQHLSNMVVHARHHRRIFTRPFSPVSVCVRSQIGNLKVPMRRCVGKVQKEGMFPLRSNEVQREACKEV